MLLTHSIGQQLALTDPATERALWTYGYGGKPKPYFHPLCTPAGHCISLFEPHDHVWHRGLWFAIKFINEENFWEEHEPYGTQRTLLPPAVVHGPGGRITLDSSLDWVRPDGETVVIREQRHVAYQPFGADAYALDLSFTLAMQCDALLDRTVYTTWGGYGGLVFRFTRNCLEPRILLGSEPLAEGPTGQRAPWCDLSALLDGGLRQSGGIALFDHPSNPRHPTPWYGNAGNGAYNYINAAFLFHDPLRVQAGQALHLRYRALVHDGLWDAEALRAAYDEYARD